MSIKPIFISVLLLISTSPALAANTAADDVTITSPFARAVPEGMRNSGMFLTLHNKGSKDHSVVSASSGVSKVVELHEHANVGGMMKMRRIPGIDIPAGGKTVLQPGGLHVMFIGLKGALKEGSEINVKLAFEDGSSTSVKVPVKSISAMHGGMGGKHGKHGKHMTGHKKGAMKHANPMPNLMKVVVKHGDKLSLTEKQTKALAEWRNNNHTRMHAMGKEIMDKEKALFEASMRGEDKASLMAMADKIMQIRKKIISGKTDCRDNMRRILNDEQYAKVLKIYREKFAAK